MKVVKDVQRADTEEEVVREKNSLPRLLVVQYASNDVASKDVVAMLLDTRYEVHERHSFLTGFDAKNLTKGKLAEQYCSKNCSNEPLARPVEVRLLVVMNELQLTQRVLSWVLPKVRASTAVASTLFAAAAAARAASTST